MRALKCAVVAVGNYIFHESFPAERIFVSQVSDDNTGANVYIRAHGVVLYVPSE